jgi:hypothetical protein
MKASVYIQKFNSTVILFIFSVCMFSNIYAEGKSAADTIDYIVKNQKSHTQVCDDLYALGAYYFNVGDAENAYLVMSKCIELAEKYNYEKGIYDAYAILGAIALKQGDVLTEPIFF